MFFRGPKEERRKRHWHLQGTNLCSLFSSWFLGMKWCAMLKSFIQAHLPIKGSFQKRLDSFAFELMFLRNRFHWHLDCNDKTNSLYFPRALSYLILAIITWSREFESLIEDLTGASKEAGTQPEFLTLDLVLFLSFLPSLDSFWLAQRERILSYLN